MSNQQANITVETPATPVQSTVKIEHGQFGGKYQHVCEELYKFLTENKGLSASKSHRISHAYACDFGAAIKKGDIEPTKAKAGITSKEGAITLRETTSAKMKNAESTPALQVGHAVQWLGDAGKHGVSYGNTTWTFTDKLEAWITGLAD